MARLRLTILLLVAALAAAQPITDGDTIELNGTTWRPWGIDAPEMAQTCGDWSAVWQRLGRWRT